MGNRWEIATYPIMEWMATFPSPPPADWFRTVLHAGWELGIYRAAPGDLTRPHTTSTRLAVVDARGAVVERWVFDLGTVVEEAPYHPDLLNHVKHKPPLLIMALEHAPWQFVVTSYSDIWLPWSEQWHDPGFTSGRWTDNRELATRHTPRLNEFLARLREAALDLGGSWAVEWADLGRRRQFQFDEHGVRLDAENRMTLEKHVRLDGHTLTEGLRHVLLYPPPDLAGYRKAARVLVNWGGELDTPHRAELLAALRRVDVRVADLIPWDLVDIDNSHDRFTFTVDEILAG